MISSTTITPASRLIVALDTPTEQQALQLVKMLLPLGVTFKIGMELYYQSGSRILEKIQTLATKQQNPNNNPFVFLDLKLHDIPNTVEKASFQLAYQGATFFNVHASGGKAMMQAAKKGSVNGWQQRKKDNLPTTEKPPQLIGVTILTSINDTVLSETLQTNLTAGQTALHLAKLTKDSGLDGVVCSAKEVETIKQHCGKDFILVTPGIRPASYNTQDDQSRVMTPEKALLNGSDYLVIGRPVTQASSPLESAQNIITEITQTLAR